MRAETSWPDRLAASLVLSGSYAELLANCGGLFRRDVLRFFDLPLWFNRALRGRWANISPAHRQPIRYLAHDRRHNLRRMVACFSRLGAARRKHVRREILESPPSNPEPFIAIILRHSARRRQNEAARQFSAKLIARRRHQLRGHHRGGQRLRLPLGQCGQGPSARFAESLIAHFGSSCCSRSTFSRHPANC